MNNVRLSERGKASAFQLLNNGDQLQLGEDHQSEGQVHQCIQMVVFLPSQMQVPPSPGSDVEDTVTVTVTMTKDRPETVFASSKQKIVEDSPSSPPSSPLEELKLEDVPVSLPLFFSPLLSR